MRKILYVIFVIALSACGDNSQEHHKTESNPKEKTQLEKVMSTQLDALEKSKKVENDLQKAVDKRHKDMEEKGI